MFQKHIKHRLLICMPGIPHPFLGASSVLFHYYIERLKQDGYVIMLVLLLQRGAYSEKALKGYLEKNASPDFDIVPIVSKSFLNVKRFSINLNLNDYAPALERIDEFAPDAAMLFDLLSAWVNATVNVKKVVWLGDLNYLTAWYHAWYETMENPARVSFLPFAWWRARLWKKKYYKVLSKVDKVIVSSKSSEEHLRQLGIPSIYQAYPWPDIQSSERISQSKGDLPSFLFLGNLVGLGSRSALHFMVRKLYPRLVRLWGCDGFRMLISGSYNLPAWFSSLVKDKPEFHYIGFVDDLSELMSSCHAVIAPIDVPVGNRSRIVTAMSNKTLVIAHQNTALGNPDLVDGVTCWLASDADKFVARMKQSVEQPLEVATIICKARKVYDEKFHPEKSTSLLAGELTRVIEQNNSVPNLKKIGE